VSGWIGVDFDGTLAEYGSWQGPGHTGKPIPAMVERVKRWKEEGREVRIFTARIYPFNGVLMPDQPMSPELAQAIALEDAPVLLGRDAQEDARRMEAFAAACAIAEWCRKHLGYVLPITNVKDYGMVELWDDRAVQVEMNTGRPIGHSTRGLS
jgi:hypothetical protein